MNKGFTLIELLIVMVMVAALIGIALPKYNRAVERGRALIAINNVKHAAQYVAVKGSSATTAQIKQSGLVNTKYFTDPIVSDSQVKVSRIGDSEWQYTLTAPISEDSVTVTCSSGGRGICTDLGLGELGLAVGQNQ